MLFYLLPLLVIAWAIWGVFDYKKLKVALKRGNRNALIREYKITALGELVGGAVALGAVGISIFKPLNSFGVSIDGNANSLLIGGGIGLVASVFLIPIFAKEGKKVVVGDVEALMPQNSKERLWYALVALSAGLCEELVFRGYGLRLLHSIGLVGAALIAASAIIFGLVHIYQGVVGAVMTALMGVLLAIIYLQTGTLWWAIIAHAALDLRILLIPQGTKKT